MKLHTKSMQQIHMHNAVTREHWNYSHQRQLEHNHVHKISFSCSEKKSKHGSSVQIEAYLWRFRCSAFTEWSFLTAHIANFVLESLNTEKNKTEEMPNGKFWYLCWVGSFLEKSMSKIETSSRRLHRCCMGEGAVIYRYFKFYLPCFTFCQCDC